MPQFLYFAPGRNALNLDSASQVGLRHCFDSAPACRSVLGGPGGARGVLCSVTAERLLYAPDQQKWRPLLGNDHGCQVGMWTDSPPTPGDLQRELTLPGQWLRLDDGHQWLIPTARMFVDASHYLCVLPQALDISLAGELIEGGLKRRYQGLWDLLMAHEEALAAAEETVDGKATHFRYHFDKMAELVAAAFAANYRVDLSELVMLGIYDPQSMQGRVIEIVADRERQIEFVKKKLASEAQPAEAADSGTGSSGLPSSTDEADCPGTTPQHSPT